MSESVVEKIQPLFNGQGGIPYWWQIQLKDGGTFALHQNWFAEYGKLKHGDKVRYVKSKATLEGYKLFDELRKIEKKENHKEKMRDAYEGA